MKTLCTFSRILFLLGLTTLITLSCSKPEGGGNIPGVGEEDPKALSLTYSILGAEEAPNTYSLAAEADECRINDIYTLFFRAASHGDANKYVGYTRSSANSSNNTGTSRVTLPPGEDVQDEWQLVFVANLDLFANLGTAVDVDAWLTTNIVGKTLVQAKPLLTAIANKTTGLKSPFVMAGELTKGAGTNVASITLSRGVARIDISNSAAKFVLESAQVWSGRTLSYIVPNVGTMTGTASSDFVHYSGNEVTATTGNIRAKLYAFENFVIAPTITDHTTTCLIIKGRYDGAASSYYRVNICPKSGQQRLLRNSVYTINIANVTSSGEADPGDAFDQSQLKIDYTINEWDDTFNGTYIFDRDGNGLAVSSRNVVFSEQGGQSTKIEVFTIISGTNPIAGSWGIGGIVGADAVHFSASKVAVPVDKYFSVGALTLNDGTVDRDAVVDITWGTITLPVSLKQLNPTSMMEGIKVSPYDLWFAKAAATKEVCVNLQGNFAGITRADIQNNIMYGTGSGWLTIGTGATADNPAAGLFYYNIRALALTGSIREAEVKFVVTQGTKVMTSQIDVTQTTYDIGDGYIRQLSINMWQRSTGGTYVNKGIVSDIYTTIKGLPAAHIGPNHLQFPIAERLQYKYIMSITSSMAWKIVAPGYASTALTFSKKSDAGDPFNQKQVEITATQDVSIGWDGTFYIEYENGNRTEYIVHQQGVLATSYGIWGIYYYGTVFMNGKLWLDRNLGATSTGYYDTQNFNSTIQDVNARGTLFPVKNIYTSMTNNPADMYNPLNEALRICPAGFRFPSFTAADDEWEWVRQNGKFSGASGDLATGGISYKHVPYITYSSSPVLRWFIPRSGSSMASSDVNTTYYAASNLPIFTPNATQGDTWQMTAFLVHYNNFSLLHSYAYQKIAGTPAATYPAAGTGAIVRCIKNN